MMMALLGCAEPGEGEGEHVDGNLQVQTAEQALSSPEDLGTSGSPAGEQMLSAAEVAEALRQPWDSPEYAQMKPPDEVLAAMEPQTRSSASLMRPEHVQKQKDFKAAWKEEAALLRQAGVTEEALEVERRLFKERFFGIESMP